MSDEDQSIDEVVQRLSNLLLSLISDSVPVAGQMDAINEAKELSEQLAAIVHNRLQEPSVADALQAASIETEWESLADATIDAAAQLGL